MRYWSFPLQQSIFHKKYCTIIDSYNIYSSLRKSLLNYTNHYSINKISNVLTFVVQRLMFLFCIMNYCWSVWYIDMRNITPPVNLRSKLWEILMKCWVSVCHSIILQNNSVEIKSIIINKKQLRLPGLSRTVFGD